MDAKKLDGKKLIVFKGRIAGGKIIVQGTCRFADDKLEVEGKDGKKLNINDLRKLPTRLLTGEVGKKYPDADFYVEVPDGSATPEEEAQQLFVLKCVCGGIMAAGLLSSWYFWRHSTNVSEALLYSGSAAAGLCALFYGVHRKMIDLGLGKQSMQIGILFMLLAAVLGKFL
jgi:hypothetical protein